MAVKTIPASFDVDISAAALAALEAAYDAGWRPPTVKTSGTFTGTSKIIDGLVSSNRYRITVTIPAETADATTLTVQPNASDSNGYIAGISGSYATPLASASLVAGITKANGAGVFEITIGARTGGMSSFQATMGDSTSMANAIIRCGGATTTDYTSLTLTLSTSRTNVVYKVIEETV